MIITTTQGIDGRPVSEYLGIVSAALVMVMPGGNKAVQRGWQTGVEGANEILTQQAIELRADAILAVRYEVAGAHLCATGTAVRLS
jgi:uncharacterized protein YbjQ (UPF0145 family)